MTYDFIIVGAGLAGAVLAERVATQLNKKVLLVEARNHVGGNCYDEIDENGIIIHKYGPHLFHTDYKDVYNYLGQFAEWQIYNHKVLGYIDGQLAPIPFNLNSLHKLFPKTLAEEIEKKLLLEYNLGDKVPIMQLKNDDKYLAMLRDYVFNKIFLNYTSKQWDLKPDEIDGAVTARVPVFIGKDDRYFNDKYQAVPKYGYTKMFEKMLSHPNIKLMLNTDCKEILTFKDNEIFFFGNKFDGQVIFTGQIDELFDLKFGELPYRSMRMEFATHDTESYQESSVVNYPNNYDFVRTTEFRKIHPSRSDQTTVLTEFPQPHVRGVTIPYYPIFTDEQKMKYDKYADYAKSFKNLQLVGRLAEYKYYDMDDIVFKALDFFDKIAKGE